jgi:hypothetical protein
LTETRNGGPPRAGESIDEKETERDARRPGVSSAAKAALSFSPKSRAEETSTSPASISRARTATVLSTAVSK